MLVFIKNVFQFLGRLFHPVDPWEQYLRESRDIHELERRIREITR